MTTESIDLMAELKATANPFPGLRPFQLSESHLYFGRDGQSEQLLRKLSHTRFVTVVGTSGSGKSSLVRAGLQPALYGGSMASAGSDWRIAIMRPGNDPIGNLALALNEKDVFGSEEEDARSLQTTITEVTLRRGSLGLVEAVRQTRMPSHENLLVLVDQFEELFRFAQVTDDPQYQNDAAAFVKLLLEAGQQREISIYVVLTLRSDFLGDCSLFWDLPEAINEGQYLIPRLTREQRREAITGPVAVGGAEITQRLVNCLLNDMGDNPDQLPILQHALMRTWNRWKETSPDTAPIDLKHYQAIGEMREALSLHADEAYNELPDERSREIAEKIFRGLTEKGSDNRETRRPIVLKELCSLTEGTEAEVIAVIEVFRKEGRSFLTPSADQRLHAESLIDISHESLIRNWKRLNEWVDDEARSARIYRRLAETAVLHAQGDAGLWRDPDLQLALVWRERSKPNKAWARRYHPEFETAMSFLDESVKARDAEIVENERKRKREVRRARLTAIIFGLAFIFSLAALLFANYQRVKARDALSALEVQRNKAEEQKNIAFEARNSAEKNAEVARTAELEAVKQKEKAEEQKQKADEAKAQAERQTLIAQQSAIQEHEAVLQATNAVIQAKAAEKAALSARENEEKATDSFRQQLYTSNIGLATTAYEGGYLERANALLNASKTEVETEDPRGFEWYYLTNLYRREIASFGKEESEKEAPAVIAFSPDGKTFVAGSSFNVELWDARTRQSLGTLPADGETKEERVALAFSPHDSNLIVTGSGGGIKLRDVASRKVMATLEEGPLKHLHHVVAFSPDGKRVAARTEGAYKVWDTASRKLIATFPADLPDMPASDSEEDYSLALTSSPRATLAFSPNGRLLAGSTTKGVQVWDIDSQSPFELIETYVTSVGFITDSKLFVNDGEFLTFYELDSPDSRLFITNDKRSFFYIRAGTPRYPAKTASAKLVFSPDGKTFATAAENPLIGGGGVKLWDTDSLKLLATFEGLGTEGNVASLAFSPDGKTLAVTSLGKIQFSDTDPERNSATVSIKTEFVMGVASLKMSPDGTKFFTVQGSQNGYIMKLWDKASLKLLDTFNVGGKEFYAFSPDGRTLATDNPEGGANIWDIASRKLLATYKPPTNLESVEKPTVKSVAFSPDGKTLAVGGSGFYQWWDIATQKLLPDPENVEGIYSGHYTASYHRLTFSPNGKVLAMVALDNNDGSGMLEIVDTTTRQLLVFIPYFGLASPTSMVFSPDSKTLAVSGSSSNATVDIWDISSLYLTGEQKSVFQQWEHTTGTLKGTLEGHTLPVTGLAFSADGKTLASGSYDQTVRLWSTATYQPLLSLKTDSNINDIAFSPDNQTLLTAGWAGVKLWYAPRNAEKNSSQTLSSNRALPFASRPETELAEQAFPQFNLFEAISARAWRDYSRVEMTHGGLTERWKKTETSMKEMLTLRPLWPEP